MTLPFQLINWASMASSLFGGGPYLSTVNPGFGASVSTDGADPLLARAKAEMASQGITSEQRARAYTPHLSEAFYANVNPVAYTGHGGEVARALAGALIPGLLPSKPPSAYREDAGGMSNPHREDAWRLYLGLPQKYGTFDVSDYRPSHSSTTATYFTVKGFAARVNLDDPVDMRRLVGELDKKTPFRAVDGGDITAPGVMANYQWTKGKDARGNYVAYYDIWDLHVPGASHLGHPYEIYDRIYYNPKTFEIVNPTSRRS